MKKIVMSIIVCFLLEGIVWAIPLEKGLVQEYTEIAERAALVIQQDGKDKAFADITNSRGRYISVKNEVYVYVIDSKGVILSHSTNKLLIGQQFLDIRDADGKLFYQEIIKEAAKNSSGWVTYKTMNPVSKRVERKDCFFKKQGDYIVCATK